MTRHITPLSQPDTVITYANPDVQQSIREIVRILMLKKVNVGKATAAMVDKACVGGNRIGRGRIKSKTVIPNGKFIECVAA